MNKLILPLLLATAAFATPASANWFHNPYQGINRNIGSAPNPTPADIQEMRLPQATKVETPMLNYTVVEPAKDPNKTASAATSANAPAQGAGTVPAAAPSR
ncbi:MAG TPA: hypothetical protein VGM72_02675 [Micropepsaceae bacterium]|jgi:hypothetical protein